MTREGWLSAQDVGAFYDEMCVFFELVWKNSAHVGLWADPSDDAPFGVAQDRLTDRMIEAVGASSRVVDVGCGLGRPAIRLAAVTGCDVVGLTVSGAEANLATQRACSEGLERRARFLQVDAVAIPFDAGSFDAAWAIESLSFVPDRARVLREIARVLRPGGVLAVADAVELAPLSERQWTALVQGIKLNSITTLERYPELLRAAGLEVLEVLEVSGETRQMTRKLQENIDASAPAIAAHYGPEFLAAMRALWPELGAIYDAKLGYALITARKPLR